MVNCYLEGSITIFQHSREKYEDFESSIFYETQKNFVFESRVNYFSNGHICNVVSTSPDVVKIDVENGKVFSTLSNVVKFNVEINNVHSTLLKVVDFNIKVHNVVSTLIWRCVTSWHHINLKQNVASTSNRHWNVCWNEKETQKKKICETLGWKKNILSISWNSAYRTLRTGVRRLI